MILTQMTRRRGHVLLLFGVIAGCTWTTHIFAGGSETKLSREAIPVNPEADAQLAFYEIPQLEQFAIHLQTQARNSDQSPANRILAFFDPSVAEALAQVQTGDRINEELRHQTIVNLNQLLRRTDLYDREIWIGTHLSEDLKQRFEHDFSTLGPVDKARLNRLLLHETYPSFVAPPTKPTFPRRPRRFHIFGDRFLATGDLQEGIRLPTGAVWQPSLFAFGTLRSTLQTFDTGLDGVDSYSEWVNRWDINFNLALTPTERILVGFRPLDEAPEFTGYQFDTIDGRDSGFKDPLDGEPSTFFFEGDLGELFPIIDRYDTKGFDVGFAVGRQPIRIQDGFMIDDTLDAIGFTKNNMFFRGTSNVRMTALYAWNNIDRNGGIEDDNANVFGFFTSTDFRKTSMDLDFAYVASDDKTVTASEAETSTTFGGNSFHIGAGFIQRVGLLNTRLRINASIVDKPSMSSDDGLLLFADMSYTPAYSQNLVYATSFLALDTYSALARRPTAQGPLSPVGILFEGPGIGRIESPIDNTAQDAIGGAVGYQLFFYHTRAQLIAEVGGRIDTKDKSSLGDAIGVALRYQWAMGQRYSWRLDGAAASIEEGNVRYSAGVGLTFQY